MNIQNIANWIVIIGIICVLMQLGEIDQDSMEEMEEAVEIDDLKPTISIIKFHGEICGGCKSKRKLVSQAFNPENLKLVILDIDSPGGDPTETEMIGSLIKYLARKRNVTVMAFVGGMATSGGYWLSCMADRIYAAETSVIGSIGVVFMNIELTGVNPKSLEKEGMELRTFATSKEKMKSSNETVAALLKNTFGIFKAVVKEGRADKIKQEDEDEVFSGKVWSARRSLELGLIDGILHLDVFLGHVVEDDPDLRILRVRVKKSIDEVLEERLGIMG